ncbi:MAG: ribosome maturation factor RimM [Gemmatimonadetes bacterium]|nr:ribosome maturation factor RimM [Gemmatimonadota bacterium]
MAEGVPAAGPELLVVGTVLKPHGIKGEFAVRLETDQPDQVFTPGRVLRLGDPKGRPVEGTVTVERARAFKGGLLVKTREHGGRSPGQDELRGRTLLMPAGQAVPPTDDEVFYHEAVGMKVVDAAGASLGTVGDLYETPAGVLLGVRAAGGREILIPFVREMVRVQRDARTLVVEAPAGLLEL